MPFPTNPHISVLDADAIAELMREGEAPADIVEIMEAADIPADATRRCMGDIGAAAYRAHRAAKAGA